MTLSEIIELLPGLNRKEIEELLLKIKIKQSKINPHIFIFNGPPATGKTILNKLLNPEACFIQEDFIISQESVKRLVSKINLLEKPYCIITCNTNRRQIELLISLLKSSWEVFPKISYVHFEKVS